MTERVIVDANAVIASLRSGSAGKAPFSSFDPLVPVHVLGELYTGAYTSKRRDENLRLIEEVRREFPVLSPDEETARVYGSLRARYRLDKIGESKMNDVWIAALCIRHDLPLLTADHGFDSFTELRVIHW